MVSINEIELSLKRLPEFNPHLAKTISPQTRTNCLLSAFIAILLSITGVIFLPQHLGRSVGGTLAAIGLILVIYILRLKVDGSTEAGEERIKYQIYDRIRKAKLKVTKEQERLTTAAHQFHTFHFDTANAIANTISFNSYTVKVLEREPCLNVGLRQDKVLYRTEYYAAAYTNQKGKLQYRTCSRKVPDRVKFTIGFAYRQRAIKGVMPFEQYKQMIALYNARPQKAQALADFHNRCAIAAAKIQKHGDQLYISPEEKQAQKEAQALAEFDRLLAQINQNVPIEIDESEFANFDELLGLDQLSDNPNVENDVADEEQSHEVRYSEAELRLLGLPAIRKQFNLTARSYEEAFNKLRAQGMIEN